MKEVIDLTGAEFQGRWGYDVVDLLDKPGIYILPFADYSDPNKIMNNWSPREVNVVHVHKDPEWYGVGEHLILVEQDGQYQDFYYNGNQKIWKFNSNPGESIFYGQLIGYKGDEVDYILPDGSIDPEVIEYRKKISESIPEEYKLITIGIKGNLGLTINGENINE